MFKNSYQKASLDRIEMTPEMRAIFNRYADAYRDTDPNFLRKTDYQRWSYVLELARGGGRMLDVGIGVGQFIYAAQMSPKFAEVVGVDKKPHSKLLEVDEDVELVWSDAADLPFDDRSFETVTCMECLEHMDDDTFEAALGELRRVASGELFMTVPFEEDEPMLPGHLQRFDRHRIRAVFPDAKVTLLRRKRSKVPWALLEEDHG